MSKETKENIEKYMTMIKSLDLDLYEIKVALLDTGVNPQVITSIIRAIANIYYGVGHGRIEIFLQKGKITSINSEERMKMDVEAVLIDTRS